jgi:hypothetical protein
MQDEEQRRGERRQHDGHHHQMVHTPRPGFSPAPGSAPST